MGSSITVSGSYDAIDKWLGRIADGDMYNSLESLAQEGVAALSVATPSRSGLTASSWSFEINRTKTSCEIIWSNSDVHDGFPIAVMLQHGYGTGTGGYVQGRDYINPAIKPIFDRISDQVWKAVTTV